MSPNGLLGGQEVLRDTVLLAVASERNDLLCKQVVVRTRLSPMTIQVIGPNSHREGEATRECPRVAKYLVLPKAKA